jgi:hypothetical protein
MTKSNCNIAANGKGERKNTEVVSCMDCFWANLHRYGSNPILAQCTRKPNPGNPMFPYRVEVASARWICPLYKHQDGEKFIQQRISRAA